MDSINRLTRTGRTQPGNKKPPVPDKSWNRRLILRALDGYGIKQKSIAANLFHLVQGQTRFHKKFIHFIISQIFFFREGLHAFVITANGNRSKNGHDFIRIRGQRLFQLHDITFASLWIGSRLRFTCSVIRPSASVTLSTCADATPPKQKPDTTSARREERIILVSLKKSFLIDKHMQ